MPPKPRVTRDRILDAAVALVRRRGADALNARTLAEAICCSTQPIFSNFRSMDELRAAVLDAAQAISDRYTAEEIARGEFPPYKAAGMGYIRFAREEEQLFRLLYMRDRTSEDIPNTSPALEQMADTVQSIVGLSHEDAFLFHVEMWIFVHGIATMIASHYLEWDSARISEMLTDAYQGLIQRFKQCKQKE